ncbi:hypothetical protein DKG74_01855 [Zavarzinia aquatilis]|uniref:HTH iclR-type domain-containing protein n=2 Tax=Zavarzinia aquatilis TaxID=2211142 RepID=A0A317EI38_9PROT|nr:hypothetical protein DKG74_01855 [Zavarzinia aquatilis]
MVTRSEEMDNSRLFTIHFLRFFLRASRQMTEAFDGDMEMAIIAQAVAISTVEALLRENNFKEEFRSLDAIVGTERQRGCNALSISQATGLPRETVRRKMLRLVEMDILIRRGKGDFIIRPGVVQGPIYRALYQDIAVMAARMFGDCLDDGIFNLVGKTST